MWISARTALTLAVAALLLVVVAVAAPLMPRPHLPPLPEGKAPVERTAAKSPSKKFGDATMAIDAPERVRTQVMAVVDKVPAGAANWAGRVGTGTAATPSEEVVARLRTLLNDSRTVADPRAERAEASWVVRFVREDHRVDVMADPSHDRVVVVRDGTLIGAFAVDGLHREFANLTDTLRKAKS